jgi:hypothetical protein
MSGKKSQVKKVSRASGKTSAKKSSVKQSPYRLVREEDIDYLIQLATSNIEMLSEDPVKNRKAINHIEEELDELLAQKKVLESSKKKEVKGLIKEWKDIIIDEDLTEGSEEYDRRYRQYFFLDTVAREISKEILEKNLVGNLSEIIEVFDKATTMEEIEELDDIAYITDKVQEIVGKDILPDRQAEKIRERIANTIEQEGEGESEEEKENILPPNLRVKFDSIEARKGNIRVTLDYIGEGRSGDYDPEDSDDISLMRVYVERQDSDGDGEEIQQDASTCLMLPATTPKDTLQRIANDFLQQVLNDPENVEEMVGGWTWIDFRE